MPANKFNAVQLVWFKRDLRLLDHAPLFRASQEGPYVCLYVYEPELLNSPEFDSSHLNFINEALTELAAGLARLGGKLITRRGNLPDAFETFHRECAFQSLWSHEETGNAITYRRDLRVAEWCRSRRVSWQEIPQTGVIRRLKSRDGWSSRWEKRMNQAILPIPDAVSSVSESPRSCGILALSELGLPPSTKPDVQRGGESEAQSTLRTFLEERGARYRSEMSSPFTGAKSCSRLSPYLAWGCISLKTVHQAVVKRVAELRARRKEGQPVDRPWFDSLRSFSARLRWHCHFMQKLEDEPSLEFENMCRAYDGLREPYFNHDFFEAWCRGLTGYPMVDACMRSLLKTGWINFRMRAMLVSFASNHLWLHWRQTAIYLGRNFLDFEPGIHFSQFQMQSGTTGINTIRIYSPVKQVIDQDPCGIFIRQNVPELENVPQAYIAEPHRMPLDLQKRIGCVIGRDYATPIVDHATAYRQARGRLGAVRRQDQTREAAKKVYLKHGSRKRPRAKDAHQSGAAHEKEERQTLLL